MSTTQTVPERLTGTWNFVPVHSSADFSVPYLVAKFRSRFDELDASFADGVLSGSVKVDSIDLKDPNFKGHVMSPEFFDAANHPEISFRSAVVGIDGDTLELEGDLTIKGITRSVQAKGTVEGPTEDFMGNTRLGFQLETTIDRTEFGVSWNADLPKGGRALSDKVTLIVALEFTRA